MEITIGLIIIVIVIFTIRIGISSEKKDFNNGICPICDIRFKSGSSDSQGGRSYDCPRCMYTVWVSYDSVDREYRRAEHAIMVQENIDRYDNMIKK